MPSTMSLMLHIFYRNKIDSAYFEFLVRRLHIYFCNIYIVIHRKFPEGHQSLASFVFVCVA